MASPLTRRLWVAAAAGLLSALVVAGLAELRLHGPAPSQQGRGEAVFELAPASVHALSVSGAAPVELLRTASGWALPGGAPADAAAADALLARLAALRRRATLARAGTSADELRWYGLDAPRLAVTLRLEDGRTARYALGGTTGEDGAAFVLGPSGEVVVVAAEAASALEEAIAALRPVPRPGDTASPAGPAPARPARGG